MDKDKVLRDSIQRVQCVTLGCSKNRVDSEHLLRQLQAAGMQIAPEAENLYEGRVDAVILNTCGFIQDAKEESIEAILDAVQAKQEGCVRYVFVFGCLSQRYREDLPDLIPEVDGYFGAYDIRPLLERMGVPYDPQLATRRYLTTPSHYAYLKISEGCDRTCSYCAIPKIRGKHCSVPMEALVEEAQSLVAQGARELIVVAQDTTYYGLDRYRKRMLAPLLERLSQISGVDWLRVHYSYPDAFPEDVLEIMAQDPKVAPYIDIPLQHISDKVLSAMRRSIDGAQTRALIEKIRNRVPDAVLRTTLIVGHPGEGKREFRQLLDFVADYRFERLGAFPYSEEEGTWGAANLKDTLSRRIKQERYEELMELQSGISYEYNLSRVGTRERVLIDSVSEDGVYVARTQKESPEVDGEVLIRPTDGAADRRLIGQFAEVEIAHADEYDLLANFI